MPVLATICRLNIACSRRYVKFDTFHPAVDRGLPVTRVISRVVLQQLLAEKCFAMAGEDVVLNDQNVVDYEHEVRRASSNLPMELSTNHKSLQTYICCLISPIRYEPVACLSVFLSINRSIAACFETLCYYLCAGSWTCICKLACSIWCTEISMLSPGA